MLWDGDYEGAFAALQPLPVFAVPYAAEALIGLGRMDEALRLVNAAGGEGPDSPNAQLSSLRALGHAVEGDRVAAEREIRIALAGRASFAHAHHIEYIVGAAYAALGMREEALEWFRHAAVNGFPCLPAFERDAFIGGLRSDPDFRDLLDWLRAERERLRQVL